MLNHWIISSIEETIPSVTIKMYICNIHMLHVEPISTRDDIHPAVAGASFPQTGFSSSTTESSQQRVTVTETIHKRSESPGIRSSILWRAQELCDIEEGHKGGIRLLWYDCRNLYFILNITNTNPSCGAKELGDVVEGTQGYIHIGSNLQPKTFPNFQDRKFCDNGRGHARTHPCLLHVCIPACSLSLSPNLQDSHQPMQHLWPPYYFIESRFSRSLWHTQCSN